MNLGPLESDLQGFRISAEAQRESKPELHEASGFSFIIEKQRENHYFPYKASCLICERVSHFIRPNEAWVCLECRDNKLPKDSILIRLVKWLIK